MSDTPASMNPPIACSRLVCLSAIPRGAPPRERPATRRVAAAVAPMGCRGRLFDRAVARVDPATVWAARAAISSPPTRRANGW
jgi:hypothetical protein